LRLDFEEYNIKSAKKKQTKKEPQKIVFWKKPNEIKREEKIIEKD
jgi:hypothetical protein